MKRQQELEQLILWLKGHGISLETIAQKVATAIQLVMECLAEAAVAVIDEVGRLVNSIDCSRIGYAEDNRESREDS